MSSEVAQTRPISLAEYKPFTKYNMCIYGATGVGKTIFGASSKTMKTFIFDMEEGIDSASAHRGTNKDLVFFWDSSTKAKFMAGVKYLAANVGSFNLVVVDTATELSRIFMEDLVGGIENEKNSTQQQWGQLLKFLEAITRMFRALPCHVLYICHEIEFVDAAQNRLIFGPDFQGQFKRHYSKHFSLIARAFVHQTITIDPATNQQILTPVRLLNCQRDSCVQAKDRSQSLDKYEYTDYGLDYLFQKMITMQGTQNPTSPTNG